MSNNYQFFNHRLCEYYPCHQMDQEKMNCLFCFCPLYVLKDCGGNYQMKGDIKDCSNYIVPHQRENYDYIMKRYQDIQKVVLDVDKDLNNG